MKSNVVLGAATLLLSLVLLPTTSGAEEAEGPVLQLQEPVVTPAKLEVVHPFAAMAGSWSGGGTISLTNDINERLRCRASYTNSQTNSLALSIRCASDNYKFELTSTVVERRGHLSGQWKEASYNVSGKISGRVTGNRVTAVATGESFNAALSVITNGNRQSVRITPKATYLTNVQITLNRR
jgi:hypothetical protein